VYVYIATLAQPNLFSLP